MPFESLIGNPLVKTQLNHLLKTGGVHHALLFSGIAGCGKKGFATELAIQMLGEESRPKVYSGNHPDFHLLRPSGKGYMHTMASTLSLIEEANKPPFNAPCKIFLIDDAHRMAATSSNALLKTLEEPLEDTYFFLITDKPDEILPTIVSRLQKVSFDPIPCEEVKKHLLAKEVIDEKKAHHIAMLSSGSLKKAYLSLDPKDQQLEKTLVELLKHHHFSDSVYLEKALVALEKQLDDDDENMPEKVDILLERILLWHRDIAALKCGATRDMLYFNTEIKALEESASYPTPNLSKITLLIEDARLAIAQNIKVKNSLERLFYSLASASHAVQG